MSPTPDGDIYTVVKRYADAWAANDLAAIVGSYHDDVVFHYFGRLVSIKDVLAGERFGLVVAVERFERNGRAVEIERLLKYTVRDGKLAECWVYDEDQRLVDELLA